MEAHLQSEMVNTFSFCSVLANDQWVNLTHLHAGEANSYNGCCALLALSHLGGLLLLRDVVSVLLSAHLQVQHARQRVPPRQVLQQDKFWHTESRKNHGFLLH